MAECRPILPSTSLDTSKTEPSNLKNTDLGAPYSCPTTAYDIQIEDYAMERWSRRHGYGQKKKHSHTSIVVGTCTVEDNNNTEAEENRTSISFRKLQMIKTI